MRRLPTKIIHHPDSQIDVVEEMCLGDIKGYFDAHGLRIVIEPAQLTEDKWTILFHELLHVIESSLLESGVIKRRIDHRFITHAAPILFGMLAMSDLLGGIPAEEAKEMVSGWIAGHGETDGKED